jgi:hypothetical protein
LYEMLTGRLPFESPTTAGLIAKQILETPPALETRRPDLPAALSAAVRHAMAKSAAERPDARALAAQLAEARTSAALVPPSVVRRRTRWKRIRWTGGGLLVVAAVLALVVKATFQGLTTFSGGAMPSLSASDANIPPALIGQLREAGMLEAGETPTYAFVPAGKGWDEVLMVTDRGIIRRTGRSARRVPIWSGDYDFTFFRHGDDRGLVVIEHKKPPADTLYRGLSGAELGALSAAITAIEVAHTHGRGPPPPSS